MPNVKSWRAPEGSHTIDDRLYPKFEPLIPLLLDDTIAHGRRDLTAGISMAGLLLYIAAIAAMVDVDKRGGYFRQRTMNELMDKMSKEESVKAKVLMAASKRKPPMTLEKHLRDQAYALRVLMSRFRGK